jgi:hypothetical protein
MVDYYPSEEVTVEFYRDLPTHGYRLIILRIHSSATPCPPPSFYTSEPYSNTKFIYQQLTDQVISVAHYEEGPWFFGILPKFVLESMNGEFRNTTIIMMGCEGLEDDSMAKAFVEKGAKVYIGWSGSVLASHTDTAVTRLLRHLILERQPVSRAVENTMREVGPDPTYKSVMVYYPLEARNHRI